MREKSWWQKTTLEDYRDDIERILYKLFPYFSQEDHEDVSSKVMIKLWKAGFPIPKLRDFPNFNKPREPYNFLFTTVRNTSLSHISSQKKRVNDLPLFEEMIETFNGGIDDVIDVRIIIESLPPNQQNLVYQALEQPREFKKIQPWEFEYLIKSLGISSNGFIH